eukprot:gene15543-6807_t
MRFSSGMLLLLVTFVCFSWKWFIAAEIFTTGTHFREITTESSRSSTSASKDEDFTLQEEMLRCSRDNECKILGSRTGTEKLSAIGKGGNLSEYDEIFEKKEADRDNDARSDFHCTETFRGPWWSTNCFTANLNNDHQDKVPYVSTPRAEGASRMSWRSMDDKFGTIRFSEMMIRPYP